MDENDLEKKREKVLSFMQKSGGKKLKIRRTANLSVSRDPTYGIHPTLDFYQNSNYN